MFFGPVEELAAKMEDVDRAIRALQDSMTSSGKPPFAHPKHISLTAVITACGQHNNEPTKES